MAGIPLGPLHELFFQENIQLLIFTASFVNTFDKYLTIRFTINTLLGITRRPLHFLLKFTNFKILTLS